MGAINFIEFKAAHDVKQAFIELVSEAVWDYGHDPYNGTISTTRLRKGYKAVAEVGERFSEDVEERAYKAAEDDGWGEKWESRALYCGVDEKGGSVWAFYGWAAC